MKTLLIGLLMCSALVTVGLGATDVSGNWSGFPLYLTLQQDGTKLTGTARGVGGDQVPLGQATIEDDHIRFRIGSLEADLRVKGDEITGEAREGGNVIPLFLRRVKPRDPSAPPPAFEAVSLKRSAPEPERGTGSSMKAAPGRLTFTNVTLKMLIQRAWNVKDYQVVGPDWLKDERYDVIATMPAGSAPEDVLLMMQSLLVQRFHLETHRQSREMAVYGLMVEKNGFKLESRASVGHISVSGGPGGHTLTADSTMFSLATTLSNLVDRPVVDMTELKGTFHVSFRWTPEERRSPGEGAAADTPIGPSIFTALHEVGLKLQPRRASIDVLIVDRAEKIPEEN